MITERIIVSVCPHGRTPYVSVAFLIITKFMAETAVYQCIGLQL